MPESFNSYTFSNIMDHELYYVNSGSRLYGAHPVIPYGRPYWECQAVLSGRIGPLLEDGRAEIKGSRLWIFEAGHCHGWTGEDDRPAEIIVFHVSPPDKVIREVVRKRSGVLDVNLTKPDIAWLRRHHAILREEWTRMTEITHLKIARFINGLSLLALERIGYRARPRMRNPEAERVDRALYWFRQNVTQHPSVGDVASAVGVSEVHLRRLFRKERQQSPLAAFQSVRMEAVREALRDRQVTVEAAAAHYGYADASSLTRAYRRHFGQPPRG